MIGLVIVTHGGLASEFLAAMEHVVGPQRGVAAICIGPEDDMERRRRDIVDAAAAVNDGDGVILLTDMFGGTPSNLAISVMEPGRIDVVAGVNLPMLIEMCSAQMMDEGLSIQELMEKAAEAGKSGMQFFHASQIADDDEEEDDL